MARTRATAVRPGEENLTSRERATLTRIRNGAASANLHERWLAARNRHCPGDVLSTLIRDESIRVCEIALRHPNLPEEAYAEAWLDGTSWGYTWNNQQWRHKWLQQNPNAPMRFVTQFPRNIKLMHPKCNPAELETAARSTVNDRMWTTWNTALPVSVQLTLSRDTDLRVRKNLSRNNCLARETIANWIPREKSPIVLRRIVKLPNTDTELAALIAARLLEIRAWGRMTNVTVARHTDDQEALRQLVKNEEMWVASIAVMNKNLDEEGMLEAATNKSKWVRRNLTAREDCTEEAAIVAHLMNND